MQNYYNNNYNSNTGLQPASQAQINYLKKLGYVLDTTGLTSTEASQLIKQLEAENGVNHQAQQPQQNVQAPVVNQNQVAAIVKDNALADALTNNLNDLANDGMLYFPENYSIGNALKSAMSKILTSDQCDKLMACTAESKKQALTEYVIQGLDASKNQAYFIPYGNKMVMMRSYFGDVAVAKSTGIIQDVYAIVIYEGDEIVTGFDDYGRETLISHNTKFENRDKPIKGAYAVAVGNNGYKAYCFMTMNEIKTSWEMSKVKGGKFQTQFQQEAAKRTVIRRLVKMLFNTSENTTERQTALIGSYNRTTADEYDNSSEETKHDNIVQVQQEQVKQMASKKPNVQPTPVPEVEEDDWLNNLGQ